MLRLPVTTTKRASRNHLSSPCCFRSNSSLRDETNERIPRHKKNDYTEEYAQKRREFIYDKINTVTSLEHISSYSIDSNILPGNIENFIGVAQVPIGLSGPIQINGEYAKGAYYIPLATTEGTLIASYNRGMRLSKECGGIKSTIVDHKMQRAPVFLCEDALKAREFGKWIDQNFNTIKQIAETSTKSGKLIEICQYPIGPNMYLRFNYTTKDAAGQNMCGKATYIASEWIIKNYNKNINTMNKINNFKYMLSGSIDTDKKHSFMNMINTRGRKVIAEVILKRDVLKRLGGGITPEQLFEYRQIGNAGAMLSGSVYNGAHAANGLTALFIATGQDVANVAESHAGITYTQLLPNGDYYWSVTLPSLIVATHGGGTNLPTQKECLKILQCDGGDVTNDDDDGKGNQANKLAEICAATVLAGDISLTCAVLAGDWVSSHDQYGRNK
mmetsp:Transcript_47190/g.60648  ORF Transcript_47190/g.60648 Transcript_47190/m.60648 type:complete len:444 (+) Transcript_47190:10-1341(+)